MSHLVHSLHVADLERLGAGFRAGVDRVLEQGVGHHPDHKGPERHGAVPTPRQREIYGGSGGILRLDVQLNTGGIQGLIGFKARETGAVERLNHSCGVWSQDMYFTIEWVL